MRRFAFLIALARRRAGWLGLGAALALLSVLANAALMATAGWFIAAMAAAGLASGAINYFIPSALIRLFAMLRIGARYLERLLTHDATLRVLSDLRVWCYGLLEAQTPGPLERLRRGDLLSRLGRDLDTLDRLYVDVAIPMIVAAIGAPVLAGFAAHEAPLAAAWLFACLLAAGGLVPWASFARARRPGRERRDTLAELRAAVGDHLLGYDQWLAAGDERRQARAIGALQRRLIRSQDEEHRAAARGAALALGLTQAGMLGVLWLGLAALDAHRIAGPVLPMLVLLALAAFETVAALPGALAAAGAALAAADRVSALDAASPAHAATAAVGAPAPGDFDLCFEKVEARRPGHAGAVLRGIDLELRAGERVALVGASGAGKSTLAALALALLEPSAGRVLLGARPIGDYAPGDYREWVAGVLQDQHLFNTSIARNLRLAAPQADDAALRAVCARVGLDAEIGAMSRGYDTEVGEFGHRLSGGQRRRLAIAQALLRAPRWLVLDEPTEGLDPAAARALVATLLEAAPGCGVLMVTHRGEGLERMDRVAVLDGGRLIACDTPARVFGRGGRLEGWFDALDETRG